MLCSRSRLEVLSCTNDDGIGFDAFRLCVTVPDDVKPLAVNVVVFEIEFKSDTLVFQCCDE